jgi:hypothetical protein
MLAVIVSICSGAVRHEARHQWPAVMIVEDRRYPKE